jgi:hypothetical protein
MSDPRRHAHELIDQLPEAQLFGLVHLLETIVDPVARAVAAASPDDEPVTAEDRRRFQQGQAWFAERGKGIAMEDLLAEFGAAPDDRR